MLRLFLIVAAVLCSAAGAAVATLYFAGKIFKTRNGDEVNGDEDPRGGPDKLVNIHPLKDMRWWGGGGNEQESREDVPDSKGTCDKLNEIEKEKGFSETTEWVKNNSSGKCTKVCKAGARRVIGNIIYGEPWQYCVEDKAFADTQKKCGGSEPPPGGYWADSPDGGCKLSCFPAGSYGGAEYVLSEDGQSCEEVCKSGFVMDEEDGICKCPGEYFPRGIGIEKER